MTDKEEQNINGAVGPGRPSKYEKIEGKLDIVRELAINGFSNDQIAKALGIARSTLQLYLKEYPEFSDALEGGKILFDSKIISALGKRGLGYDYVEEHLEYAPGSVKEKDGESVEKSAKIKSVKKVKKHVPANVSAALVWIYNRQKNNWKRELTELPNETPQIPEFENLPLDELKRLIKEARRNPDEG